VVIALAALLAMVLGVIGFRAFVPGRRFTEYLYRSLQLFVIYVDPGGAPSPEQVPVALDAARFLAPAAAAAASIRAVLGLFGQRATRAWVRYFVRDHVVVCGLGPVGARLAAEFHAAGHRVVAVEADGSAAAVHDSRAAGVIVLVGDPTDRALLRKAGLATARYLIVASDDDGTNADVALAARDAVVRRRPLPCFVHVAHPGLSVLLAEAALASGRNGHLQMEFFNALESVPPMVLDEFPPGGWMLVAGPGRLGRAMVVHAARRWSAERGATGPRLRVILVGSGAGQATAEVCLQYPRLDQVCDLRGVDVDVASPQFEQGAYADGAEVTGAYVAVDDDASGLQAALSVSKALPHVPVVVLTAQHSGLATLVSGIRSGGSAIALFDVLERSCRPGLLLNGTIELLAQAIHADYLRTQRAAGRTVADNQSLRDWDELAESTRDTNRAQAADVGTKLAAVGCRIQRWTDWTGDGVTFDAGEVERMAELEHERWCRDQKAGGWTFGPVRDDQRKVTPFLAPWDQLSDDVKEYDRNAVRALPELLTYAGFEIVRLR